jgi:hypothetical protein
MTSGGRGGKAGLMEDRDQQEDCEQGRRAGRSLLKTWGSEGVREMESVEQVRPAQQGRCECECGCGCGCGCE